MLPYLNTRGVCGALQNGTGGVEQGSTVENAYLGR
jgi:hypothetical protein